MKKFFIAAAMVFLALGYTFAQDKTNDNKPTSLPVIQKGYYGIGNNQQQLTKPQPQISSAPAKATKGYYAMKGHTAGQAPTITIGHNGKAPVSKGYYAIGDNHKKLAKPSIKADTNNIATTDNEYAVD